MKHLINMDDLKKEEILEIFKDANKYLKGKKEKILKNKTIINIFFENSTRTRTSFEIASKNLGAKLINLDISKSSTKKGETLADTVKTINAMKADAIIVRHKNSGVPQIIKNHINCSVINAGDGSNSHPTQALLDLFTIKQYMNPKGKKIAIVGDIKNSRVANSNIKLLSKFGMDIILVAPPQFLPKTKLRYSYSLKKVIKELDIILALRTQIERHSELIYASLEDYASDFCINKELINNKDILILHPGPVNRNIDISDELMSDSRTKVLEQVENGIYVRMAVLKKILEND